MAQQQFPPLKFAPNLIRSHGGYGTSTMTAAGVWIDTLDNSKAAMQALDPGETLIDTLTVATIDGTPWRRSTFMAPMQTLTISITWPQDQLSTTPTLLTLTRQRHRRRKRGPSILWRRS